MRSVLLGIAAALLLQPTPAAAADEVAVTPALVATVQNAVRWRAPAWDRQTVKAVTAAVNDTREPATILAMAVLESDMRPLAVAKRRRPSDGAAVVDVGLCGVACVLGPGGRCTNQPVRGLTVDELKDPRRNVLAAARVLQRKRAVLGRRALAGYNDDPDGSNRYSASVRAIVAAFAGVVEVARVRKRRVRELARLIAAAVLKARKS
jgi:hypothetical protein